MGGAMSCRKWLATLGCLALSAAVLPGPGQAVDSCLSPLVKVRLYRDAFDGGCAGFSADDPLFVGDAFDNGWPLNDAVSSLIVSAGYKARLWDNSNFGVNCEFQAGAHALVGPAALCWGMNDAFSSIQIAPAGGNYGNPNPHCSDGQDNDGDGKVDHPADPGCADAGDNDETDPPPPPPPPPGCAGSHPLKVYEGSGWTGACKAFDGDDALYTNDFYDNGHGLNDNVGSFELAAGHDVTFYADSHSGGSLTYTSSQSSPGFPWGPSSHRLRALLPAQCADGLDNDGDGRVDHPADPGCSSAQDDDEYNAPPTCLGSFLLKVYESEGHAGGCKGFDQNDPVYTDDAYDNGHAVNDNVRSVCVAAGYVVTFYEHSYAASNPGASRTFGGCPTSLGLGWGPSSHILSAATPPAACGDGVDNDNDGLVDHPNDPGCSGPADADEWNPTDPCAGWPVIVYRGNWGEGCKGFSADVSNLADHSMDNQISSISIASGYWVKVYREAGYTPLPARTLAASTSFCPSSCDDWNDAASSMRVYRGDADTDGDGIRDADEHDLGTNPNDPDTDHDLKDDWAETQISGQPWPSDPNRPDTDFDGYPDAYDLRPAQEDRAPLVENVERFQDDFRRGVWVDFFEQTVGSDADTVSPVAIGGDRADGQGPCSSLYPGGAGITRDIIYATNHHHTLLLRFSPDLGQCVNPTVTFFLGDAAHHGVGLRVWVQQTCASRVEFHQAVYDFVYREFELGVEMGVIDGLAASLGPEVAVPVAIADFVYSVYVTYENIITFVEATRVECHTQTGYRQSAVGTGSIAVDDGRGLVVYLQPGWSQGIHDVRTGRDYFVGLGLNRAQAETGSSVTEPLVRSVVQTGSRLLQGSLVTYCGSYSGQTYLVVVFDLNVVTAHRGC